MAFLNISIENKKSILNQIDEQNYFGLGNSCCSRLELYIFMVALGYNSGYTSEFEGAKDSLVREEYVKSNNITHAFSALYFWENKEHIEDIANTDKVYPLADKYANTGFSVIADYMKEYSQHSLSMKLMAEMDEMYESIKEDL